MGATKSAPVMLEHAWASNTERMGVDDRQPSNPMNIPVEVKLGRPGTWNAFQT